MKAEILEKLTYVRGHPGAGAWFKGEGKSEVTVSRGNWTDEEDETAFSVCVDNLTFNQTKRIVEMLGPLRLDESIYKE